MKITVYSTPESKTTTSHRSQGKKQYAPKASDKEWDERSAEIITVLWSFANLLTTSILKKARAGHHQRRRNSTRGRMGGGMGLIKSEDRSK